MVTDQERKCLCAFQDLCTKAHIGHRFAFLALDFMWTLPPMAHPIIVGVLFSRFSTTPLGIT